MNLLILIAITAFMFKGMLGALSAWQFHGEGTPIYPTQKYKKTYIRSKIAFFISLALTIMAIVFYIIRDIVIPSM